MLVTYLINTLLAIQAFQKAKNKNLPAIFWAIKTFLLGKKIYTFFIVAYRTFLFTCFFIYDFFFYYYYLFI